MGKAGWFGVAALMAGLSLTACAAIHPPAPYLPSRASITPGSTVTVRGNQNVYAIARENNVPMRDIIVLNDLRAPFALKAGQKLTLPANAKSSRDVAQAGNDMPAPYAYDNAQTGIVSVSQASTPTNHGGLANSAAVEQADLPPLPPQKPASSSSAQPAPSAMAMAEKPVTEQTTPSPVLAAPAGVFTPAPAIEDTQGNPDAAEPSGAELVWPVQGPVLSGFGPKGQGLSNDGINISAPKGAPVVAAASGIVVYSGNEIKGFGNLILIRHQGGMVTAYAHLDRAMVNKDTVVAQGDMIGTVGKTGNVPSPQLHFEVRSHGKPADPEKFLKAPAPDKTPQG